MNIQSPRTQFHEISPICNMESVESRTLNIIAPTHHSFGPQL